MFTEYVGLYVIDGSKFMSDAQTLKQRIRSGEEIVALRCGMTASREALQACLADGSYDYLYVDGQHTPFSEQQLADFCSLAEDLGLPVQFRIPHNREAFLVGRYLDFGPSMIVVPEVMDEQTAEEAVNFAYYPPVGFRSWGGEARFGVQAMGEQFSRRNYADWWNNQVVLSVMMESVEAVINARKFAKPEIDYLGFGPADLQFSIEQHPEFPFRTMEECMKNVSEQIRGTATALALNIPTDPADRDKYRAAGITLFADEGPA